jgi:D-alanyl-D-alanine carboxypeptidase
MVMGTAIKHWLQTWPLVIAFGLAVPAEAQPVASAAPAPINAPDENRIAAVMAQAGFAGTVLIARGDSIIYERAFGTVDPAGTIPHTTGAIWRWASVTKQVTATIAMQEVAAGRLNLDTPIRTYLRASRAPFADQVTARMLMQHVSGLPDTNDSPHEGLDWPRFYRVPLDSPDTGVAWCEGPTDRRPPSDFRYGDCDFIMMGAVLEAVTGKPFADLVAERISRPLGLNSIGVSAALPAAPAQTVPGYDGDAPETTAFRIENFGPAGALYGTTHDLLAFDRALMTGRLLPAAQRAEMWAGQPRYGFAALGQWVFETPLAGCGRTSVRIVERRGFIGGIVMRNIILPELDMVIIMTSNRAGAEAAFAEIWQQAGVSHDVLAAALCPAVVPTP